MDTFVTVINFLLLNINFIWLLSLLNIDSLSQHLLYIYIYIIDLFLIFLIFIDIAIVYPSSKMMLIDVSLIY